MPALVGRNRLEVNLRTQQAALSSRQDHRRVAEVAVADIEPGAVIARDLLVERDPRGRAKIVGLVTRGHRRVVVEAVGHRSVHGRRVGLRTRLRDFH